MTKKVKTKADQVEPGKKEQNLKQTCMHRHMKAESTANSETGYEMLECLDCGEVFDITYY